MDTPDPAADQIASSVAAGPYVEASSRHDIVVAAGDAPTSPVPDERRILAFAGEVRRVGRWVVPRLFRVRALLGEVRVDLRESVIPQGFTFDVRALGSRVTLVVPPGVNVVFDVFAVMGNAINQAHEPTSGDYTSPSIRVIGSAFLGEVRVLVRARESELR